jgi:uncharacterized protein YaaN involved in tellurite resistance
VLAKRFLDAGYDTFAKIAAAGEEGLKKIPGVNPRMLSGIVAQAAEFAQEAAQMRTRKVAELKQRVSGLKAQVQDIAVHVRDRFGEEVAGKTGKKVEQEILKVITSLERAEEQLENRLKKAGKGLAKTEQRLTVLAEDSLKGFGKGLKKARKSLQKVFDR